MDIEKYNLMEKYDFEEREEDNKFSYIFESIGTKGSILKGVYFETRNGFVYQMGLADLDPDTFKPNFKSNSNNGDIQKVIATTVWIGMCFLQKYPNNVVGFVGNETRKTKFYQRIITQYLSYFLQYFEVYGVLSLNEMEIFNPQIEYFGFYFKNKKKSL